MSENFVKWLENVSAAFLSLNTNEKQLAVQHILGLCDSQHLLRITQSYLPSLLCKDFLSLLPLDISDQIVIYFDFKTALCACQVSRTWLFVIENCKKLWRKLLWECGVIAPTALSDSALFYKSWLLQHQALIKNGKIEQNVHNIGEQINSTMNKIVQIRDGKFATLGDDGKEMIYGNINEMVPNDTETNCIISHLHHLSKPRVVWIGQEYIYVASMNTVASFHWSSGELYREYHGHVRSVTSLDSDCHEGLLLSSSGDHSVKLWNIHSAEIIFSSEVQQYHTTWVIIARFLKNLNENTKVFVSLDKLHCLNIWCARKKVSMSKTWTVRIIHSISSDSNINTPVSDNIHKLPFPMNNTTGFYFVHSSEYIDSNIYEIYRCLIQESNSNLVEAVIQCTQKIEIENKNIIESVLGIGNRFFVFKDDTPSVKILDLQQGSMLISCSLELYCSTCLYLLEFCDWLDGFSENKDNIYLFTLVDKEKILRWRLCQY